MKTINLIPHLDFLFEGKKLLGGIFGSLGGIHTISILPLYNKGLVFSIFICAP